MHCMLLSALRFFSAVSVLPTGQATVCVMTCVYMPLVFGKSGGKVSQTGWCYVHMLHHDSSKACLWRVP